MISSIGQYHAWLLSFGRALAPESVHAYAAYEWRLGPTSSKESPNCLGRCVSSDVGVCDEFRKLRLEPQLDRADAAVPMLRKISSVRSGSGNVSLL